MMVSNTQRIHVWCIYLHLWDRNLLFEGFYFSGVILVAGSRVIQGGFTPPWLRPGWHSWQARKGCEVGRNFWRMEGSIGVCHVFFWILFKQTAKHWGQTKTQISKKWMLRERRLDRECCMVLPEIGLGDKKPIAFMYGIFTYTFTMNLKKM